jgi:4-hydroxyphenylpyruvate dioxygenase-like putative hemolysin
MTQTASPLGTNFVTQIGVLVHDIEKTAEEFKKFLGVEPRFVLTEDFEFAQTQYKGSPTRARARLAFFNAGPNIEIELIQPDMEPSTWREDLNAKGECVHHIAFVIKGMNETIGRLAEMGMPLLQRGEYPGGRYAYIDASKQLKLVVELLEND